MTSRSLRVLVPLLVLTQSCTSAPARPDATEAARASEYTLAQDITVRRIAPGVWMHTTLSGEDFGLVPANGLIVEDGDGSLLVDTGWNEQQAEQLADWAASTLGKPVRAAVATHFHDDRTAGIPVLSARGIPVHGLEDTVRLARERGKPVPTRTFTEVATLGPLELFFPGAGHAPDNIVVVHRDSQVMFGGCFVKDAEAKDLGNLGDAVVSAWPASLERVQARYPDTRIIVPGHGAPGGTELLDHTRALLR
ncbi:subclass B1 metallo-beta-lactamase [Myxococcus fulvus]|uniref:subclass B1 metallo-beta-lactamase n=1 Tax=Myxococcus fulvus TaxID=33 RepID=UPI00200A4F6C|nr:subclass B1 metallo-beta-lactamase [Myxococcus fulvus]MCK8499205.1 subclass B1 metallo-beta-lactamase [Myxococcus fulvus]